MAALFCTKATAVHVIVYITLMAAVIVYIVMLI